ncbi:MAG TPA: ribonuclease P protein component [Clostridiaceae bacterium]|jgi:ribonuclease P protein component|nr:ribonuclease P protein component [Clostridiaceae bacterium]
MKRTEMLKMNYEFNRVFHKGNYYNTKHLTLYVRPRDDNRLMLGITVSKQVKGSVKRNHVKRWLREMYRATELEICPGYDLVIVGRFLPQDTNYHKLLLAWNRLIREAKIFCPNTANV